MQRILLTTQHILYSYTKYTVTRDIVRNTKESYLEMQKISNTTDIVSKTDDIAGNTDGTMLVYDRRYC